MNIPGIGKGKKGGRKAQIAAEEARRAAEAKGESVPAPAAEAPVAVVEDDPELKALEEGLAALEQQTNVEEQEAEAPKASNGSGAHVVEAETPKPKGEEDLVEDDDNNRLNEELDDIQDRLGRLEELVTVQEAELKTLRVQNTELLTFKQKTAEVMRAELEAQATEVVDGKLEKGWAPKFAEMMKMVRGLKEKDAKADAELGEILLHLPLLRRMANLESLIARAEKAAQIVQAAVTRLTGSKTQTAPNPDPLDDPLA